MCRFYANTTSFYISNLSIHGLWCLQEVLDLISMDTKGQLYPRKGENKLVIVDLHMQWGWIVQRVSVRHLLGAKQSWILRTAMSTVGNHREGIQREISMVEWGEQNKSKAIHSISAVLSAKRGMVQGGTGQAAKALCVRCWKQGGGGRYWDNI